VSVESKTFDFLSALTGVVVLTYLGAWVYALVTGKAEIAAFVKDVGPTATLLIGYWARGVS
jgi:hypothetical protein